MRKFSRIREINYVKAPKSNSISLLYRYNNVLPEQIKQEIPRRSFRRHRIAVCKQRVV